MWLSELSTPSNREQLYTSFTDVSICLSVCLSVCQTITFESLREVHIAHHVYLHIEYGFACGRPGNLVRSRLKCKTRNRHIFGEWDKKLKQKLYCIWSENTTGGDACTRWLLSLSDVASIDGDGYSDSQQSDDDRVKCHLYSNYFIYTQAVAYVGERSFTVKEGEMSPECGATAGSWYNPII